ncbi:MAG TPA: hypothetical protein VMT53_11445 [Terriglobales bacterium]|nr:hypothetical protein [Terriglobales bacterium]
MATTTPATLNALSDSRPRSTRAAVVLYALTAFLSAFLLFQVQLISSKYILPWFGGSAAVWTTSMLVFQVLLLAGYAYAHLLSVQLSPSAQNKIHLGLLATAFVLVVSLSLAWPSAITPSDSWKTLQPSAPVTDVITLILAAVGLPFFVLSTSAPLLQRWLTNQGGGAQIYRLYSVSNLGSLLGLLTFPFIFEPMLHLKTQGRLWTALFCVYVIACACCARSGLSGTAKVKQIQSERGATEIKPAIQTLWFLLAACASSLLLATTNLLCQEVISLPLLWVVPLALYLVSFILCFDHPRWYRRDVFHSLFALGLFGVCLAINYALRTTEIIILPVLLFVACMICHGELVRLKPDVRQLTRYYLIIAAGGAFGGVFVSILAPRLFAFFTEFQISLAATLTLVLCCLFLDSESWLFHHGRPLPFAMAMLSVVAVYASAHWVAPFANFIDRVRFYPIAMLVCALVLIGAYIQGTGHDRGKREFQFAQMFVMIGVVLTGVGLFKTAQPDSALYRGERNFYGALRIYELAQGGKALFHGNTLHGAQLNPPNDRLPMAYYGPESGIGVFLRNHPKRATAPGNIRVGIVGLGAGTLAVYGNAGDYFRYYEINPQVVALSSGQQPVFTYVRDSAASVEMELGDARLLLEHEAQSRQLQNFDVLVLDAFSGDAVPAHLLTREAFETYWRHLNSNGGVIAVHVSSRHINLLPVLQGLANYYHALLLARFTAGSYPFLESLWVFLARNSEDLRVEGLLPNPPPLTRAASPRLWTDDYSDIVSLLY